MYHLFCNALVHFIYSIVSGRCGPTKVCEHVQTGIRVVLTNVCVLLYLFTASESEFSHGIKRAESCDSVASDSSVLEMLPDMPKIGQLEFALEYDR